MFCSPIHLLNDMALWFNPFLFDKLTQAFRNYTNGDIDEYDCGLTSTPCKSNITKEIVFSAPTFVFWFDMIVVYVCLTAVSLIGIVGNAINIHIISTSNIASDSTNNLFLWLSVSDLVTALNCGFLVAVCFLCFVDDGIALTAFNFSFPYIFGNINKISLLSLDFVTVISIQRAVAVVLPFKISRIFTYRNTNIIIAGLIFLAIITSLPPIIGQYPRWVFHPHHNRVISIGYAYMIFDYLFLMDYVTIYFYVRSALDLVIIFVAISLTISKLNSQEKSRSKMTNHASSSLPPPSSSSTSTTATKTTTTTTAAAATTTSTTSSKSIREVKVIRMSVTVCVVTFVIFCFNIVVSTTLQVYADNLYTTPVPFATNNAGILLNAVGASFNFFLYFVMSTPYKQSLYKLLKISQKG